MKVMVLKSFRNLGSIGSIVNVKAGYAKNYLVPNGIVSYATKSVIEGFEKRVTDFLDKDAALKSEAVALKAKLQNLFIKIVRSASDDGRLYGSVNPRDILATLSGLIEKEKTSFDIKRGDVFFVPIREIGFYDCTVNLHADISVNLRINVCRSESEGLLAEQKLLAGDGAEDAKSDRRVVGRNVPKQSGGLNIASGESISDQGDVGNPSDV